MAAAPPPFQNPVPAGRWVFTSPFGPRINPVTHEYQSLHNGLDIAVPSGTTIVAAAPGTVVTSGYTDINGNWVKVDHGGGWSTAYLHLTKSMVSAGQRLMAGQVIGLSGATGRATGPHLHFIIYKDNAPVDPKPLVSWTTSLVVAGTSVARSPWLWPAVGATTLLILAAAWRRRL
jgi:murein DD-endopeptidase MepM/ murein hydrolase activator NlpD